MSDHEHAVCCCGSLRIRFLDLIHIHLEIDLLYPIFNAPFVRCHLGVKKIFLHWLVRPSSPPSSVEYRRPNCAEQAAYACQYPSNPLASSYNSLVPNPPPCPANPPLSSSLHFTRNPWTPRRPLRRLRLLHLLYTVFRLHQSDLLHTHP